MVTNIDYKLTSNTKDIWMRDYMPIQKKDGSFVRYIHNPDYLVGYRRLRTNPKLASKFLDSEKIIDIELNLDGGNIVRAKDNIICTDKIFKANTDFYKEEVLEMLKQYLNISEVIIIPEQPFDMTGHSDGLVRFIDDNTVMIPSFIKADKKYEAQLIKALRQYNLEIKVLPSVGFYTDKDGGTWIPYINYMQVGSLIILPVVGSKVDAEVIEFFKLHFGTCNIEWIDATTIIETGGALNCISWNIYQEKAINE